MDAAWHDLFLKHDIIIIIYTEHIRMGGGMVAWRPE
jgi:hypothetical protein